MKSGRMSETALTEGIAKKKGKKQVEAEWAKPGNSDCGGALK
jgi:hypothetical protein